jgi:predicted MFS family arabinose efflux permease
VGVAGGRVADRKQPRWGGAVLIMLCQSMQALAVGGIALFLPLIRAELGLSFTQAGSLAAAATLVYALMQIPSGYLADRVGPKRLFLIGLLGTNVLTLLFARLSQYSLLLVNQALTGFFRSLVFAPGLLLISALFPPQRRATAMGLYVAGGFSSSIVLNSLGPVLVGPLGWRNLFTIFALAGLLILFVYWRFGGDGVQRAEGAAPAFREAMKLFRHGAMWLIALIQYVRLAVVFGIMFWLPSFIVDDRGYSLQIAGLAVAIGGVLTALSNFFGGYISDRLRNPYLVIGCSLAMVAVTTVLLPNVDTLALLMTVIALNAVFIQLYFGPLFSVPIELFGAGTAGLASGFGNFFANVGGFTFTYTLGALKDATGSFSIGFYSLAALCLPALLATIALSRARRVVSV